MADPIQLAVERLSGQLPLQARQRALPPAYAEVHRGMLRSLATRGRPLSREEVASMLLDGDAAEALARLSEDDLIVVDPSTGEAVGAYPMTTEDTVHHLKVDGVAVNAMCALDALAVAPMYGCDVEVESRCRMTATPIRLRLEGDRVTHADPSGGIRIGVAWQNPCGHAAHSMCREMVFLVDEPNALAWQGGDAEARTLFTLDEALDFAARFFKPLVG